MWSGKLFVRPVHGDGQGAGVCTTMKMERGLNVLIAHCGRAAELRLQFFPFYPAVLNRGCIYSKHVSIHRI